jgi:hypothetical protein
MTGSEPGLHPRNVTDMCRRAHRHVSDQLARIMQHGARLRSIVRGGDPRTITAALDSGAKGGDTLTLAGCSAIGGILADRARPWPSR